MENVIIFRFFLEILIQNNLTYETKSPCLIEFFKISGAKNDLYIRSLGRCSRSMCPLCNQPDSSKITVPDSHTDNKPSRCTSARLYCRNCRKPERFKKHHAIPENRRLRRIYHVLNLQPGSL